MLQAELVVRHTRRHMPTRRVAPASAYLPMSGPQAAGILLVGAVVHEFLPALDDDDRDEFAEFVRSVAGGIDLPRIAVRHRVQRDTHGLDRSRHRVEQDDGRVVVELDTHGAPIPQLLGAVVAVAMLPPSSRHLGLDAIRRVINGRRPYDRRGIVIRRLVEGVPHEVPWAPGATWQRGAPPEEVLWDGVDSELRWAMEVLGFRAGTDVRKDDVNRRFRRLLRDAHPDTGAADDGAAERIEELSEARDRLLDLVAESDVGPSAMRS